MWLVYAIVGCGDDSSPHVPPVEFCSCPPPEADDDEVVDTVMQDLVSSADILVVLDPALAPELADALPSMLANLAGEWRIGFVSSAVGDPATTGILAGVIDPTGGSVPPLSEVGPRDAIGALFAALEPGANPGFPSAEGIHFVLVAGEGDESSLEGAVAWSGFRDQYWPGAELSVLAADTTTFAGCVDGISGDVAEPLDGPLGEIALRAFGLDREFFLTRLPVVDTLVVEVDDVNGARLEFGPEDWVHHPEPNSVVFSTYVPSPGSEIRVSYTSVE